MSLKPFQFKQLQFCQVLLFISLLKNTIKPVGTGWWRPSALKNGGAYRCLHFNSEFFSLFLFKASCNYFQVSKAHGEPKHVYPNHIVLICVKFRGGKNPKRLSEICCINIFATNEEWRQRHSFHLMVNVLLGSMVLKYSLIKTLWDVLCVLCISSCSFYCWYVKFVM